MATYTAPADNAARNPVSSNRVLPDLAHTPSLRTSTYALLVLSEQGNPYPPFTIHPIHHLKERVTTTVSTNAPTHLINTEYLILIFVIR
jgi:hypothetical protein